MSLLGLLRKRSSTPVEEPPDPRLTPGSLERWRAMSPRERRRLHNEAHESATHQVTAYGRPYQENYDAHLELELGGHFKRLSDAVAKELRNPDWRSRWEVVVGQDSPPSGPWGWMVIEAHSWPVVTIKRVAVAFPTADEARQAGERAAASMWKAISGQ